MNLPSKTVNEFQLAQALFQVNSLVGQMLSCEVRQEVNHCIMEIVVQWVMQQSSTDEEAKCLYDAIKKNGPITVAAAKGLQLRAEGLLANERP